MSDYKIVIADDENTICSEIEKIIKDKFVNKFTVAKSFDNGTETLEYLKNNYTDVLISDIKMPGCSGIDIAKYIHDNKLKTKVILITGFRIFEYAKYAIDYGVYGFWTKPINFTDVIDNLNQLYEASNKSVPQSISINNDYSSMIFRGYCRKTIVELMSNIEGNVSDLSDEFDAEHLNSAMARLIFKSDRTIDGLNSVFLEIGETCTSDLDVYFIKNDTLGIEFFGFCFSKADAENRFNEYCRELCNKICEITGGNMKYSVQTVCLNDSIADINTNGIAEKYFENFKNKNTEKNVIILEKLQNYYIEQDIRKFLNALSSIAFENNAVLRAKYNNCDVTSENLPQILVEIEEKYSEQETFKRVIDFINSNISDDINIGFVADNFHFNKSYFSRLFKQKTGKSFTEYLFDYRLNMSMKMLKETNLSVSDISKSVGLKKQYFHRIFKNKTGVTPKEYRDNLSR